MADSDDEYEEDYEDESFETLPGSSGADAVASDSAAVDSGGQEGGTPAGGDEVVSLEEYMSRLEQQAADGDEDTNEIMSTITRGLDGLSPPTGHRNHSKASPVKQIGAGNNGQAFRKQSEDVDEDDILKRFNVKLSPSKVDDEVSFSLTVEFDFLHLMLALTPLYRTTFSLST